MNATIQKPSAIRAGVVGAISIACVLATAYLAPGYEIMGLVVGVLGGCALYKRASGE